MNDTEHDIVVDGRLVCVCVCVCVLVCVCLCVFEWELQVHHTCSSSSCCHDFSEHVEN